MIFRNTPRGRPGSEPETPRPSAMRVLFVIFFGFWIAILIRDGVKYSENTSWIPYSEFLQLLDRGQIESVQLSADRLRGRVKTPLPNGGRDFEAQRIADDSLPARLEKQGVRFEAIRESAFLKALGGWILPLLLMVAFWMFMLRGVGNMAKGPMLGLGKSRARIYAEKDVATRFSDVAGIAEAKAELQELVNYLRDPARYNRLGGRVPKGILLVGPPGTGKTLIARAVAGEANVPFISINGSEFVEMFVGLGAARVRDLFTEARAHAPCIIFIDELDALGKMRGASAISGANDEKEQTLNQLLAEIDGFDSSKGVVLLAATNRPEVLDPALLRSGRFDRQVSIDRPDRGERQQILSVHLKTIKAAPDLKLDEIAGLTAGFSGADLANLVNEAAIVATRRDAKVVEMHDFTQAFERIVAGLERKTRVISAEEKRRVATHEMGHATASLAAGIGETVHKVSIVPRGIGSLGHTMRLLSEDRYLLSRRELELRIDVLLAGRAAEEVFLQEISTGAADDLDKASELARTMVTRYGMSERLGLAVYEKVSAPFLSGAEGMGPLIRQTYSDATAKEIDEDVRQELARAYARALRTVRHYAGFIEAGVERLLQQETLTEAEILKLWRERAAKEIAA